MPAFHAVYQVKQRLEKAGFKHLQVVLTEPRGGCEYSPFARRKILGPRSAFREGNTISHAMLQLS